MDGKALAALGFEGPYIGMAKTAIFSAVEAGQSLLEISGKINQIISSPDSLRNDPVFGKLATAMFDKTDPVIDMATIEDKPLSIWGQDIIDPNAIVQMREAMKIPVAVNGALMGDAHYGYSMPVGGVMALKNAVAPFYVGVDIACRMKLSILDIAPSELDSNHERFVKAIEQGTVFGTGKTWATKKEHSVMDRDWRVSPITSSMKDTAWSQLGTSGSGNHFINLGTVRLYSNACIGLSDDRDYLAIMTHSGSRGTGAKVCKHYSDLAVKMLPRKWSNAKQLAWLGLDTQEGQEYWEAMNLMGHYAQGCHDVIHEGVAKLMGAQIIKQVENHHNFAWKEIHDGQEVIVHRKGATPAGEGVLGVIPGSMADPAYVVVGKGNAKSLCSASHGAGRVHSRTQCKAKFDRSAWDAELKRRGVTLISAGLDEMPQAYKNIDEVMARQADLVDTIARFDPKIVKMADDGTAED